MGTGASAQARSAELRTSLSQLYEKVDDAIRAEAREVEETNENTVDAEVHRTEASKSSRRAHRFLCQTVKRSVKCSEFKKEPTLEIAVYARFFDFGVQK